MPERAIKIGRIGLLLMAAFLLGGAGTEVALRTHGAVERVRNAREIGSAGQLVSLEIALGDGPVLARPRLIAPQGKAAELVLHDPANPDAVRLAFRVEAEREPTGEISLAYALWLPGHEVAQGKVSLTPGVEQEIALGDGALVARWLAVPVPSAQFDAYLEAETAARRTGVKAS